MMIYGILLAACGQLFLLVDLIRSEPWFTSPVLWLSFHGLLSGVGAICSSMYLQSMDYVQDTRHSTNKKHSANKESAIPMPAFLFSISFLIPFAGTIGAAAALVYGFRAAQSRHTEPDYWQVTHLAQLPFTTPIGREATKVDSRGFTEHLLYSNDDQDVYKKVLAAGNIKSTLSVGTLKQAMRHKDERIRLTAYKSLDKKVSELNRDIQFLEARVAEGDSRESSNSWLQIASNYWELLTMEKDEPVARRQLLEKASVAAIQAVAVLPINRNAHFTLGRVSLLQGNMRRARVAFTRARALGMPADKVLPYLAELEFTERNFPRVRTLLGELDPAIRTYPPLSHVTEYWA